MGSAIVCPARGPNKWRSCLQSSGIGPTPIFGLLCFTPMSIFFALFGGRRYGSWLIEGRHFHSSAVIDLVVDGVRVLQSVRSGVDRRA